MIQQIDPSELTVFVTGATAGFGAATVRRFIKAGAHVVATGRREARLRDLRQELGDRLHVRCFDIQDKEEIERCLATLPPAFSSVDVLVNNAGLALGLEPAQEAVMEDWRSEE